MSHYPLPWGEDELEDFKVLLLGEVDRMYTSGVDLKQGHMTSSWGQYSPNGNAWKISEDRAVEMSKHVMAWRPREPVIASHRAEAVRIVHDGMVKAGVCPRSAQRKARKGYVG